MNASPLTINRAGKFANTILTTLTERGETLYSFQLAQESTSLMSAGASKSDSFGDIGVRRISKRTVIVPLQAGTTVAQIEQDLLAANAAGGCIYACISMDLRDVLGPRMIARIEDGSSTEAHYQKLARIENPETKALSYFYVMFYYSATPKGDMDYRTSAQKKRGARPQRR